MDKILIKTRNMYIDKINTAYVSLTILIVIPTPSSTDCALLPTYYNTTMSVTILLCLLQLESSVTFCGRQPETCPMWRFWTGAGKSWSHDHHMTTLPNYPDVIGIYTFSTCLHALIFLFYS